MVMSLGFWFSKQLEAQNDQTSSWRVPEEKAAVNNPVSLEEKSIVAGKAVYVRECLSCHGSAGRGDGPQAKDLDRNVPDLTDTTRMSRQSDGELFYKLTVGKKPMPGYKKTLTDEERWQVINYMRSLSSYSKTSGDANKK